MLNENFIYGVDISRKITPIQVRDAIIRCFSLAQEELKKFAKEKIDIKPDLIGETYINSLIINAFNEVNGDFNNPTKVTIVKVINRLKNICTDAFLDSVIIEKHTNKIQQLIDKLD